MFNRMGAGGGFMKTRETVLLLELVGGIEPPTDSLQKQVVTVFSSI
jgi:hypothetical protein